MSWEDDERRCDEAFAGLCEGLVRDGIARTVRSAEDARFFVAAGVASVAEHRFDARLDPETLTADELDEWTRRSTARGESWGDPRRRRGALLLVEGGRRIGTIELEWMAASRYAWVSNLYVAPHARGRGIASGVLDRAHAALAPAGAWGVSPSTHWTWPRAVGFYLRHGATVRNWKHAVAFVWRRPGESWALQIDGDEAVFRFRGDRGGELTWHAAREDGWLRWSPPTRERERLVDLDEHRAEMTFALALAMEGWPLARSPELLARGWDWSDGGDPEGLAVKIEMWEAWDRMHGFRIETPRIPGLAYREHDVLTRE